MSTGFAGEISELATGSCLNLKASTGLEYGWSREDAVASEHAAWVGMDWG